MAATTYDPEFAELIRQIEMENTPPPRYQRYQLVRQENGELVFEEDEIAYALEQAVCEIFGEPMPQRRVIRLKMSLPALVGE